MELLNELSECSDNLFYPQYFIIRTFREDVDFMRSILQKCADNHLKQSKLPFDLIGIADPLLFVRLLIHTLFHAFPHLLL